jgi:hypothetical protein
VAVRLLNDHLSRCVIGSARFSTEDGRNRLDEVAATIRSLVRL